MTYESPQGRRPKRVVSGWAEGAARDPKVAGSNESNSQPPKNLDAVVFATKLVLVAQANVLEQDRPPTASADCLSQLRISRKNLKENRNYFAEQNQRI